MSYQFKKTERLCHKNEIEILFQKGKSIQFFPFKAFYDLSNLKGDEVEESPIKIAISIPKRHFKKAVDRNRLKRRCREAYRINSLPLKKKLKEKELKLSLFLIYTAKTTLSYGELTDKIILILRRLEELHE